MRYYCKEDFLYHREGNPFTSRCIISVEFKKGWYVSDRPYDHLQYTGNLICIQNSFFRIIEENSIYTVHKKSPSIAGLITDYFYTEEEYRDLKINEILND